MSKAMQLALAQISAGKSRQAIADEIGYSRTAVSLYLSGKYGKAVGPIEEAILKRYDRRICPHDGEEKKPEQCRRVALRPRPAGFPDAEVLWLTCQTCTHKPTSGGAK